MPDSTDDNDPPTSSTAYVLEELALYGYRPFEDEPDPRPLPEGRAIAGAVADMADALVATLSDTRLEPDLPDLFWNLVNLFHRAGERIERSLDANEQLQRRLQREQDGSEVASIELERALAEGLTLIERRDAMECFRDAAADQYRLHLRGGWTPRSGSRVNHRQLTSAVVDSRDFLAERQRARRGVLMPAGTLIAFSAGTEVRDVDLVWATLDRIHAKYTDMVIAHGATPTGGERIAACWADHRGVPQVPFRPDWARHRKAAPFKRNDQMLDALPKGVVVFPGTGIQDNLADKARKMGIRVWDFR